MKLRWLQELHAAAGAEEALPPPTIAEVRKASCSFRAGTAQSRDGIHVRHWELLSDAAFEVLVTLVMCWDQFALLPSALLFFLVVLLPKAVGWRPIAIFTAFYRLWAKLRRPVAEKWEREQQE